MARKIVLTLYITFIKFTRKRYCFMKVPFIKMKIQAIDWERILAIQILTEGLISRLYQDSRT